MDYDPLINPRAHTMPKSVQRSGLKQDKNKNSILNVQFRETYTKFLEYCVQKVKLGDKEWIALSGYLAMQDRIEESERALTNVKGRYQDNEEELALRV